VQLREALLQIAEIRQQMARSQVFRGYRSITTAITGVIALLAALVQMLLVPDPRHHVTSYLIIWGAAAVVSILVVACELILWCRRGASAMQNEITLLAVEQFIPCLVAGALATLVIARFAFNIVWILPGLWAVLFSLGVFASRRLLPRGAAGVAGFYMLAGLWLLTRGHDAMGPWCMGITFSVGQFLTAIILYWNLERHHVRE
jgi:hypothetical protein